MAQIGSTALATAVGDQGMSEIIKFEKNIYYKNALDQLQPGPVFEISS